MTSSNHRGAKPPSVRGTRTVDRSGLNLGDRSAFIEPWVARCTRYAADEGFRFFVFGLIVPRSEGRHVQFGLTNYPRAWLKLYDDQDYIRVDPVAARLLTDLSPFSWDDLAPRSAKEQQFWANAERFGLRHGFTVPVHGPRGQHAAIGLSGKDRPLAHVEKKALFERAWSFSVQLLEEIFGAYLQHDGGVPSIPLNPKQRDALSMIAQGKSIRDISGSLGIHPRTVEYHLASAMRRLGAASREQAIVRALLSGDIEETCYPGGLGDWCLQIGAD
jgi:DNA-binding CsgD family transcriptional regulator